MYVHYGKEAHYRYLEQQGISVSGKIVIGRFGGTFRGNIVLLTWSALVKCTIAK